MSKSCETTRRTGGPSAFVRRHIGPSEQGMQTMLQALGVSTLDQLVEQTVPSAIRTSEPLAIDPASSEAEAVAQLRRMAQKNDVLRSFIGMGYSECVTPPAIQRGILESPGWYTAYTPYQPEISQGRLEALLNFQTMVTDLTAMEVANASLLDEGTAAAEGMTLCRRARRRGAAGDRFLVSPHCHPQTIAVVRGRAEPLGIRIELSDDPGAIDDTVFGVLVQYPTTDGRIVDYEGLCARAHEHNAMVVVAADLLALTLLRAPGEFGADVVVGSTQRFGVPLGYGGPHAAFMATRKALARQMPGRLVGVSKDAQDNPALRLALQTREQHIRRDKATSNICTAQVLLAVMASMYAVHHGPDGLRAIAQRIRQRTFELAHALRSHGHALADGPAFDTLRVSLAGRSQDQVLEAARKAGYNLRAFDNGDVGVSFGETASQTDVEALAAVFGGSGSANSPGVAPDYPAPHARHSDYLDHPVFHRYRSETELMRYMYRLQSKDLSLNTSMIPLGSCTMKLNAAAEMLTITEPGFAQLHPFAPDDQATGYAEMIERLGGWLCEITGFAGVSFMPNAGAQGEYAGLQVIRAYLKARGEDQRDICLIPDSAHGTNPASAVLAGMRVVVIRCDERGDIDLADLQQKIDEHRDRIGALMVTYPSTHGVFETTIQKICALIHDAGGQVYLDGANMNAMVGLCRPGELGADVCHLNLHKTFCIPHGGGGPGMGPICVASQLVPHLPRHPLSPPENTIAPVSAAPFGSPSILPISYAYIAMMGPDGLREASEVAILNANYIAQRLSEAYAILYTGENGRVAHECILDVRPFRDSAGVEVDDIAKRLMDYGFHAPTMSWPVAGTLMIEPTESESKQELDRFCDAMLAIREEIRRIEQGQIDREDNPLKNAPHTAQAVTAETWEHPYSRAEAAYPAPWCRESKFWPAVGRIDQAHGDRHLVCSCPPIGAYG